MSIHPMNVAFKSRATGGVPVNPRLKELFDLPLRTPEYIMMDASADGSVGSPTSPPTANSPTDEPKREEYNGEAKMIINNDTVAVAYETPDEIIPRLYLCGEYPNHCVRDHNLALGLSLVVKCNARVGCHPYILYSHKDNVSHIPRHTLAAGAATSSPLSLEREEQEGGGGDDPSAMEVPRGPTDHQAPSASTPGYGILPPYQGIVANGARGYRYYRLTRAEFYRQIEGGMAVQEGPSHDGNPSPGLAEVKEMDVATATGRVPSDGGGEVKDGEEAPKPATTRKKVPTAQMLQYNIGADDDPSFDLSPFFFEVSLFLEKVLFSRQGAALVHCMAGVSRSTTALTCFLMKHCGSDRDDALTLVRDRRKWANPNTGFMNQLRLWEMCGYVRLGSAANVRPVAEHLATCTLSQAQGKMKCLFASLLASNSCERDRPFFSQVVKHAAQLGPLTAEDIRRCCRAELASRLENLDYLDLPKLYSRWVLLTVDLDFPSSFPVTGSQSTVVNNDAALPVVFPLEFQAHIFTLFFPTWSSAEEEEEYQKSDDKQKKEEEPEKNSKGATLGGAAEVKEAEAEAKHSSAPPPPKKKRDLNMIFDVPVLEGLKYASYLFAYLRAAAERDLHPLVSSGETAAAAAAGLTWHTRHSTEMSYNNIIVAPSPPSFLLLPFVAAHCRTLKSLQDEELMPPGASKQELLGASRAIALNHETLLSHLLSALGHTDFTLPICLGRGFDLSAAFTTFTSLSDGDGVTDRTTGAASTTDFSGVIPGTPGFAVANTTQGGTTGRMTQATAGNGTPAPRGTQVNKYFEHLFLGTTEVQVLKLLALVQYPQLASRSLAPTGGGICGIDGDGGDGGGERGGDPFLMGTTPGGDTSVCDGMMDSGASSELLTQFVRSVLEVELEVQQAENQASVARRMLFEAGGTYEEEDVRKRPTTPTSTCAEGTAASSSPTLVDRSKRPRDGEDDGRKEKAGDQANAGVDCCKDDTLLSYLRVGNRVTELDRVVAGCYSYLATLLVSQADAGMLLLLQKKKENIITHREERGGRSGEVEEGLLNLLPVIMNMLAVDCQLGPCRLQVISSPSTTDDTAKTTAGSPPPPPPSLPTGWSRVQELMWNLDAATGLQIYAILFPTQTKK